MSTNTRLTDGESTDTRPPRAFLMERPDGGDEPRVVLVDQFTNRYGDERVAVETPAPWDTPDGMTPANEVVKSLEWDDHHYTFEEDPRGVDADNVWLLDASGVSPLAQRSLDAGYQLVDSRGAPGGGADTDEALAAAAAYCEPGDEVVVRYESKQTGDTKSKTGTAEVAVDNSGDPRRTTGIVVRRSDGKANKLRPDDDGSAAVYSTSQYPFMGRALSVEVRPGEGDQTDCL